MTETTNQADSRPVTFIVIEKSSAADSLALKFKDIARLMKEKDGNSHRILWEQQQSRFMNMENFTEYDGFPDVIKDIAVEGQPVQVIFLTKRFFNRLMEDDQHQLFNMLDNYGAYKFKIGTTGSVELGELMRFEEKYGISLQTIITADHGVMCNRILEAPFSHRTKIVAPELFSGRSISDVFAEAEKLQRDVDSALSKSKKARLTNDLETKKSPRRPALKHRR